MRSPRCALAVAVATMGMALSGCSGGAEEPASKSKPAPSQSSPSDGAAGPGGPSQQDAGAGGRARPAALGGLQPAVGDLSNFSCEQRDETWSATGVVSNSAKEPMVYTVTVVTLAGGAVAGHASDEVLLGPGESTPFALRRVSRGAADACTPRVVRAPR